MSKLMALQARASFFLLARHQHQLPKYVYKKLSTKSFKNNPVFPAITKNKSFLFNCARFLASKPSSGSQVTETTNSHINNAETNELNKPQWERSYRYKIFYGFNRNDEAEDKVTAHFVTFMMFLSMFFVPFFCYYYYPDFKANDWCYREAHLELARREKAGEPLVNPDLIPIDRIKLPSDEELGDTEIII